MSMIYFAHAATSEGIPALKASRATIDEALREAEFELSRGAAFAWIIDGGPSDFAGGTSQGSSSSIGQRAAGFCALIGLQLQRPPAAGRRLADRGAVN